MYPQVPHRLFPDERPSIPRLVQFVLCDDDWARIDAYRVSSTPCLFGFRTYTFIALYRSLQMAFEHVYGIKMSEREAEAHIRQKVATQQLSTPLTARYASV
jgi:hypothetical protein